MPEQLKLGDNSFNGGFVNRELQGDEKYRVFVRAYTADDVSVQLFCICQKKSGHFLFCLSFCCKWCENLISMQK